MALVLTLQVIAADLSHEVTTVTAHKIQCESRPKQRGIYFACPLTRSELLTTFNESLNSMLCKPTQKLQTNKQTAVQINQQTYYYNPWPPTHFRLCKFYSWRSFINNQTSVFYFFCNTACRLLTRGARGLIVVVWFVCLQRRLVINLLIFFVTSNSVTLAGKVAILAKPNGYKQS